MNTERFRGLPYATQQPQVQKLLIHAWRGGGWGVAHLFLWLSQQDILSTSKDQASLENIEEKNRPLPLEVHGTVRKKVTVAIMMPGRDP